MTRRIVSSGESDGIGASSGGRGGEGLSLGEASRQPRKVAGSRYGMPRAASSDASVQRGRASESGVDGEGVERRTGGKSGAGKKSVSRKSATLRSGRVRQAQKQRKVRSGERNEQVRAKGVRQRGGTARMVSSTHAGADRESLNFSGSERSIDMRKLKSKDYVAQTLNQTAGPVGVVSRPKVVDFNARLKERKQAGRRTLMLRVCVVVAAVAAVLALIWFLLFSPVFLLNEQGIHVSGQNAWVSKDKIMGIAQRESGKSLFLVSSNEITRDLDNIPGVTESKVEKRFPRMLDVTVHAQEPAAMLKTSDKNLTAVDGKGRKLNSVNGAPMNGIPVIEVDDVDKALGDRAVQQALIIMDHLPKDLRQRVSKVTSKTQDSVTCELDHGNYTVIWGDSSQIKLKQATVVTILNNPNVIGDKHQIDVSAPMKPIIK